MEWLKFLSSKWNKRKVDSKMVNTREHYEDVRFSQLWRFHIVVFSVMAPCCKFEPWICTQDVSPKFLLTSIRLHGLISQRIIVHNYCHGETQISHKTNLALVWVILLPVKIHGIESIFPVAGRIVTCWSYVGITVFVYYHIIK